MSKKVRKGLGMARSLVIEENIREIEQGTYPDVNVLIACLEEAMRRTEPWRTEKEWGKRGKEVILDPAKLEDWAKIGVPGGPDQIRKVFMFGRTGPA